MERDQFLWLVMMLYFHIMRYTEILEYTSAYNLKTYMKTGGGIIYYIIATQVMILMIFELLKSYAE